MRKLLITLAIASFGTATAFAYATRMISAVLGANEQGQLAATFGFSPDTSGVVEKYGLYVVWGDVDAGSVFSAWGHRQKLTDVTPEMLSHSAVIPSEALMATKMRFFLAEPTYVQRTDGISFVEYVRSDGNVILGSGYTPNKTTAIDCEFKVPGSLADNTYYTIFCSRNTSDSKDYKTYTFFLHYKDKKHTFRLDYGAKSSTSETQTDLGFTIGQRHRLTTTPADDGYSLTATLERGASSQSVTATGNLDNGCSNELSLFGCSGKNLDDGRGNYAKMVFYGFRAVENGEVKLNLLPAKKTETVDNEEKVTYGFYDSVTGNFKSSLTDTALSGGDSVSLSECSTLFSFDVDTTAERTMRCIPTMSPDGQHVKSVSLNFPESTSPIPYVLSAVTPDGTVTKLADIGQNAAFITYALPASSGSGKATVKFRLEPGLPIGYELLPYVEKRASQASSAGAAITTEYCANGTTEFGAKVRCIYESGFGTTAWAMFCSRSASELKTDHPGQALFLTSDSNGKPAYWRYDYGTSNGASSALKAVGDMVYTIKSAVPGGLQVRSASGAYDGVIEASRTPSEFTSAGCMMLFASYKGVGTSGDAQTYSEVGNNRRMDVFWLTVKDAAGDKFALVPVKCTAEGENQDKVGFYDFVGERFLPSSTSTAFVAPETEEKSPLVVESETFLAPEMKGLVVMIL